MDLENFESDIFWNFSNANLNKIVQLKNKIKECCEIFFPKYSKNIF
jgi:hypothetical protein